MDEIFEIYIIEETLRNITESFKKYAEKHSEAIGFLCGKVRKWKNKKYIIIEEYITAENDSNATRARFSKPAFNKLSKKLKNKFIVGWAHSHPSYGSFLSNTDIQTHNDLFPEDYQVALVIDPLAEEENGVETKFFKTTKNSYSEISYAVIK
ncbi:JAB1/Mov34/MPN/PAD-1 ubiquitin protease [uncultured archaeon]|nr:JAB1/Mov34/MPN/PAD-1 ubiquitin protease [uncultured archaeon]